jgi:general secretion pathway protein A
MAAMKYPETPLDIGIDFDADLSFYGLGVKPFRPTVEPRFFWLGARHREGLATLESAVRRGAGLVVVTGEAGIGKTTLTNALIDRLGETAVVAAVRYPSLEPRDFFRVIASAYRLRAAVGSREAFLAEMGEFLAECRRTGRPVLLVVDNAQSLSRELWEEIRQLCGLAGGDPETGSGGALSVLLAGQQELDGVLAELDLARRVTLRWVVEPLTADEVAAYVAHRLEVAGLAESPFGPEAVRQVWALSRGVPRLVNAVCEQALLAGGRLASATIGPDLVTQAAGRLATPGPTWERVERRGNGTPAVRRSSGGLRRPAAAVAAGLALIALTGAVAWHLWPAGRPDTVLRALAPTLAAEPAREERPATLEAAAGASGLAVSPPPRSGAESAEPRPEPATQSAHPASPVPEPARPLAATAGAAEPAPASRAETNAPATSVRPVEMVPVLRATPPARPAARGTAVAKRGRALPERPPARARDDSTDAPVAARSPLTRGDAARGADPDPTAVIDWLLNERAARER